MQHFFRPLAKRLHQRSRLWHFFYQQLDGAFRLFDDRQLLVVPHLRMIPPARFRTGGQAAITEYGYSAGVLAAQIGEHLRVENPQALDIGSGTGKLVGAVYPFLGEHGRYTGIDIIARNITFANTWYDDPKISFQHASLYNAHYNPDGQPMADYRLPFADNSLDLAVAFSLFTHLNQPDSERYFAELARVMKPGGVALFTFFLMDDRYDPAEHQGTRWHFDRTIDNQDEWYRASWFAVAEQQIAVTRRGVDMLMGDNFALEHVYQGWWTGKPAAHLQDTLVFRRK